MFPRLEKIYAGSLSKLMYNGIKIIREISPKIKFNTIDKDYVYIKGEVYKLSAGKIYPEVESIDIISDYISIDIIMVFPKIETIYLNLNSKFSFKLNKLEIIHSDYDNEIKKLMFS